MKIKTKILVAITTSIPIGLAIGLTQDLSHQSAFAQAELPDCIRGLVAEGVSPDKAADICSQQPGAESTKKTATQCVQQEMYKTFQAESGPTPEERWRYDSYSRPVDGQNVDFPGCELITRFFGNSSWRCPTQTMQVLVNSQTIATALCARGKACIDQQRFRQTQIQGDFFADGQYTFGKQSDVPQEQMTRQGCKQTTVNNFQQWVCPVSRLRVTVPTGMSTEDAARQCTD